MAQCGPKPLSYAVLADWYGRSRTRFDTAITPTAVYCPWDCHTHFHRCGHLCIGEPVGTSRAGTYRCCYGRGAGFPHATQSNASRRACCHWHSANYGSNSSRDDGPQQWDANQQRRGDARWYTNCGGLANCWRIVRDHSCARWRATDLAHNATGTTRTANGHTDARATTTGDYAAGYRYAWLWLQCLSDWE